GAHNDGTHLLPEILRRLDAAYRSAPRRSLEGRTLGRAWLLMSERARNATRRQLAAVLRRRLRRRQLRPVRDHDTEEERRRQDFFLAPNNFVVGGIRFYL